MRNIAAPYDAPFRRLPETTKRITNKFPENFRVLGLIALCYPHARIVHCRRNPLDLGLSCYFQNLPPDFHPWSCNLVTIGQHYRHYERLMKHWREVLPTPMIEVHYESIVADLEGEARRLIDFLGLEWDEHCLAFHKAETLARTHSVWQVRQPVFKSSVERWRRYERFLEPLRASLGLEEPEFQEPAPMASEGTRQSGS